MTSKLRKYFPFFKANMMSVLSYRFNIVVWIIVTALEVMASLFLWIAVYKSSLEPVINGFTMKEMITYMVFANIFSFTTFASGTMESVTDDVKEGTIAMQITKPISYQIRFMFTTLGGLFIQIFLFGFPMYIIAYVVFYCIGFVSITSIYQLLISIIIFLLLIVISCLTNEAISFFTGVLTFYTNAAFGLNQMQQIVIAFLSGTAIPISFFPGDIFKKIVNFLPFAGMVQNPVLILLGKSPYLLEGNIIPSAYSYLGDGLLSFAIDGIIVVVIASFWCLILSLFGTILFNQAIKKVTVHGG